MQYDDTNKGAIWKNDKKLSDNHPDFKGSINVEGVDYWVSGWKRKEGDNPKSPALRLAIQKKEAPQATDAPREPGSDDDFEDLPF